MIRFFTNYSFGGYEELYLGNMAEKEEFRYYLPLLEVKKTRLAENPTDEKLQKEVERLSQYPLILRHGTNEESTMPDGVFTHISNPGCKTLYRRLGNYYVIVVSDIVSNDHDDMGGGNRENPFTMVFIGEAEDCPMLDELAYKLLVDEVEMCDFIGSLIIYDPVANGLRFSLREMQNKLDSFKGNAMTGIDHQKDVPLMVLADGFEMDYALKSQKLQGTTLGSVYRSNGKSPLYGSMIKKMTEISPDPPVIDIDNTQTDIGSSQKGTTSDTSETTNSQGTSTQETSGGTLTVIKGNDKSDNKQQSKSFKDLIDDFKSLPKPYRIAILVALGIAFLLGVIIF